MSAKVIYKEICEKCGAMDSFRVYKSRLVNGRRYRFSFCKECDARKTFIVSDTPKSDKPAFVKF